MNPFSDPDFYDTLTIVGVTSPGIIKSITGHSKDGNWDIKAGKASSGATTTFQGDAVAKFTVTWILTYDPLTGVDEIVDWEVFQSVLRGLRDGKTAADIFHPDLARIDINSVQVEKLGGITHDGKGGASVAVSFLQFLPPKKAQGGTAKGSKSQKWQKAPNDPNGDAKAEITKLLDETKKT